MTDKTTTQWKDRKGPWIAAQHLTTRRRRKISADAATEHNRHLMSFTFYRVSQLFPLPPSSSSSSCPRLTFNNNSLSFKSHPLSPPVTFPLSSKSNYCHQIKLPDSEWIRTSIPMRRIFSLVLFFPFPRWIDYTLTSYFLLIFPPSLNWSECLCARCGFFPAVTDKRPFPIQFSFSPLAQQGRIYPHILFESGLCARTQTHTRWAGQGWASRFSISPKKKRKKKKNLRRREGARIFPFRVPLRLECVALLPYRSPFNHWKRRKNYRHQKAIEEERGRVSFLLRPET